MWYHNTSNINKDIPAMKIIFTKFKEQLPNFQMIYHHYKAIHHIKHFCSKWEKIIELG